MMTNHVGGRYLELSGMAEQQQSRAKKHAFDRSFTKFSDEEGKEQVGPSFSQIMEEKITSM